MRRVGNFYLVALYLNLEANKSEHFVHQRWHFQFFWPTDLPRSS